MEAQRCLTAGVTPFSGIQLGTALIHLLLWRSMVLLPPNTKDRTMLGVWLMLRPPAPQADVVLVLGQSQPAVCCTTAPG